MNRFPELSVFWARGSQGAVFPLSPENLHMKRVLMASAALVGALAMVPATAEARGFGGFHGGGFHGGGFHGGGFGGFRGGGFGGGFRGAGFRPGWGGGWHRGGYGWRRGGYGLGGLGLGLGLGLAAGGLYGGYGGYGYGYGPYYGGYSAVGYDPFACPLEAALGLSAGASRRAASAWRR